MNGQAGGSYDELLTCALFLVVLADSTRTLSVDCRIQISQRVFDPLIDRPDHTFDHLRLFSGHRFRNDQPVGIQVHPIITVGDEPDVFVRVHA